MKPEFLNYLQQDSILLVKGENKTNVFEDIIAYVCSLCTLTDTQVRTAIWKRERMMTTGVGKGLALPHIRISGFTSPLVVVAVCKEPIPVSEYKSVDNEPISLVVFFAADERDPQAYLRILGSITAKLKEKGVISDILAAGDDTSKIYDILSAE